MPDNVSCSVEIASGCIQGGSIDGAVLNNCAGIMTTNGGTQPLHLELTLNEAVTFPNFHVSWTRYSSMGTVQVSTIDDRHLALTPYDFAGVAAPGSPFSFIIYKLGPR